MNISKEIRDAAEDAESALGEVFADIERVSRICTERVLDAFSEYRVSEAMFAPSTGYGYGDFGRDTTDLITARVFGAEAAFCRPQIISGTHALTVALFGLLRPGDVLIYATGTPYDTLRPVIGIEGENMGSLREFGVTYDEVDLTPEGFVNLSALADKLDKYGERVKVVAFQRSKGYASRRTLSAEEIGEACRFVKENSRAVRTFTFVDNCYGEFTETAEPCSLGADIIVGSLIKNAGGGMADIGGYIAGTHVAVELCGYRLSCPGVGLEAGASLGQTRNILKGFFYAPHTVAEALKTAHLAAYLFSEAGFSVNPAPFETRYDIIQAITLGSGDALVGFCRGIQSASPVDSHVSPEPWAMPGYADPVVMAAGAFVGGASIELSADGPMREPYTAFMQGGLTYESARLGIMAALEKALGRSCALTGHRGTPARGRKENI